MQKARFHSRKPFFDNPLAIELPSRQPRNGDRRRGSRSVAVAHDQGQRAHLPLLPEGRRLGHRPSDLLDRQSLGAEHATHGLQVNGWVRSATSHGKVGFLLKGLLTGPDGRALSPRHD